MSALLYQKGKQMRKAIVYASVHHGNTEKLVKRIADECQFSLIDAVKQPNADLSSYDMIGFASGIYFSKFHQSLLGFAEKNLPDNKKVFLICTYGGNANYKSIEAGKAHPYHLKAVSGGGSTVYGWVNAADISTGSTGTTTNYRVRTTADVLNIRKGPGTNYGVASQIKGKASKFTLPTL